jgi:ribonuclease HI
MVQGELDVAIDNSKARVGIGVILRDERGQVLAAMSKTRNGTLEPSTGEAFATSTAICFCRDIGVQRVVLEGDAKQIVDAVNSNLTSWSRFGHLIDDTRWILESFPQ